jgi:hypothetical protein
LEIQAMSKTFTAKYRLRDPTAPRVSQLTARRAAAQLLPQFPETSWLEASHRADRAFAAGHKFHFRLWARITHILQAGSATRLAAAG